MFVFFLKGRRVYSLGLGGFWFGGGVLAEDWVCEGRSPQTCLVPSTIQVESTAGDFAHAVWWRANRKKQSLQPQSQNHS